ncbi:MAG TPA: hypothetical protein VMF70_00405 [Gemmatimonadales bacterium]|nr:hypothetical protein [Gemmatimonadales bacterium]
MRRLAASLVVALTCGISAAGHAQGARNIASLAGVDGIEIVVEEMNPAQEALGLSERAIRSDVEVQLRRAAVHVVSQVPQCGVLPCLYVHVTTTTGTGTTASFVHVGLQQLVSLSRDTSLAISVETWRALGRIGLAPSSQTADRVRDAVRNEVDQFITAYLDANPRH